MATSTPRKRAPKVRAATRTAPGSWHKLWTPEDVMANDDPAMAFACYCQQIMGTPWPTIKDQVVLRKAAAEFFEYYPHATWHTLCKVALWCKQKKKRCPRVHLVVNAFRDAWADGALPELDANRTDTSLEDKIKALLESGELDEGWRARFARTTGTEARRAAYEDWVNSRCERPST